MRSASGDKKGSEPLPYVSELFSRKIYGYRKRGKAEFLK
jgi:hypothetical protein